jgi:hypothetical protein
MTRIRSGREWNSFIKCLQVLRDHLIFGFKEILLYMEIKGTLNSWTKKTAR